MNILPSQKKLTSTLQLQMLKSSNIITKGPTNLGFDHFFGLSASLDMAPYLYIANQTFLDGENATLKPKDDLGRGGVKGASFSAEDVPDTILSEAKRFLTTHLPHAAPVFLFLSLTSPHVPLLPTPAWRGKSKLGPYGDLVLQTDDTVGQIVTLLKDYHAYEDTLLLFTSDNGPGSTV